MHKNGHFLKRIQGRQTIKEYRKSKEKQLLGDLKEHHKYTGNKRELASQLLQDTDSRQKRRNWVVD